MDTAKLFTNGNSQAIRLPKKYRLRGKDAYITKAGDAIIIFQKDKNLNLLLKSLKRFSPDFMEDRNQPPLDLREELFL